MKKLLVVCCALTVFGGEIFAAAPVVPEPTLANVAYGRHPKQVLNFWKAKSDQPTPLVFFIHGGGWRGGDLSRVGVLLPVSEVLAAGISVVSIEYRFIPEATADKEVPPVRGPLTDAARALQFVRSKATEWNIDKARIAASGGSAGACSSLWLAFHPDLADPKNSDPVARESTRLWCAAVIGAQTTLDPQQMKEWTPNSYYGGHAFGFAPDPKQQGEARRQSEFDRFLADREKILPWIAEYSPYALVTADDPPVYLFYSSPPALGQNQKDPTHTANFGVKLLEKCKSAGVECEFFYPGATNVQHVTVKDYLIERLKSPRALGHGEGANNYPASERKGNVLPPVAKPKPAAGVTTGVLSLAKAKGDLQLTGWVQRAVRFIAAPVFTLAAPKDAVRYQAQLTDATGKTLKINSANPELNLADIWAKIAPGSFSGNISAVDQDGRVIASMKGKWHKARPFDKTMSLPPLPRPWPEVIERAMDFLINYRHLKGHDPKHPAILWHANYNFDNGNISAKVYPALGHATYINLLLDYETWPDATPTNAKAARPLARDLADVLLLHRTPAEWPFGNLFYSTSVGGKMGGHTDGDNIIPVHSGHAGLALFRLGLADNNPALIQAAWETALALVSVQNRDGSFAFRVNPKTGKVNNPYTSNVMPEVLLWDALLASKTFPSGAQDNSAVREKIAAARRRALDWMLAGPWQDYRWEGMYEDVPNQPAYFGLEWNDAAQAVEYVLARPGEFSGQREQAIAITRWIEDQFLCWYPDDVPNRFGRVARTPSALEQYRCYQPIDAHAARAAALFLAVWRATGDESYRARARALTASIAQSQRSNGSIPTFWWLRAATEEGKSKMAIAGLDCFRCVAMDARVLLAHLDELSAP